MRKGAFPWLSWLLALASLFIAEAAFAQCEKVEDQCVCSCAAGTVQRGCQCVPAGPPRCTKTCRPGERLDVPSCSCVIVAPACSKSCGACEALDRDTCSCAPKSDAEVCLVDQCKHHDKAACEATSDRAERESNEVRRTFLLEVACDGSVGRACTRLGDDATAHDVKASFYERGCNAGDRTGCTKGGDLVLGPKRLELYAKACNDKPDDGNVVSCRRYADGIRAKDPAHARSLYDASCLVGDAFACFAFGEMADRGDGGPRDPVRARAALKQGCSPPRGEGAYGACDQLAEGLLAEGDTRGAKRVSAKACDDGGYLTSCARLGDLAVAAGERSEAQRRFERACSDGRPTGVASACRKLGEFIDDRRPGNVAGLTRANTRYHQACMRGDGIGCAKERELARLLGDDDHDGVLVVDDRCPTVAEDRDGFQDDDGCIDADDDGDGIPDEKDRCRTLAESPNGIDDSDGCPEGNLALDVSCDDQSIEASDLEVTIDGSPAVREGSGYVFPPGEHDIGVTAPFCQTGHVRVAHAAGGPRPTARVSLKKGALATAFTGVAPSNTLAEIPWSLGLSYTHGWLPDGFTIENTPSDGAPTALGVRSATALHGFTLTAAVVGEHAMLGLEAGIATTSRAPIASLLNDPSESAETRASGATARATVYSFPTFKLGGRLPFGMFALAAGGSIGVERWSVDADRGSVPGLTQFALAPWGQFDAKLTRDFGLTASGGYRFGASIGESGSVNYGYMQAGLLVQPSREGGLFSDDVSESSWGKLTVRASYLRTMLPRAAGLTSEGGASGVHFVGAPVLHGVHVEVMPELSPWLVAGIGMGFARGQSLSVDSVVPSAEEVATSGAVVAYDRQFDVNVWTLPSGKLGVRLPLSHLAIEADVTYGNTVWTVPTADGADTVDYKMAQLGGELAVAFHPVCSFGLHASGGYAWGVGLGSNDGLDVATIRTGLEYQSCP